MALDLELRKTYLGGTDLSVISDLSPYGRPGDVWLEKMGKVLFEGNAATEWGKDLEPVIAMRHGRRFGVELVELPRAPGTDIPQPIFHPEFPFIAANPDRNYRDRKRVLECKSAGEDQLYGADSHWGEDGAENAVPIWYLGQTNHYIGLQNFEDGYLSAMFLGRSRQHRDYPIIFDRDLYDLMIGNGVVFWRTYVEPRVQPPVEMFSPEVAMKAVALKAGAKKDVLVECTPEFEEWVKRYRAMTQELDTLEARKKLEAAKIAQWIAEQGGTKVKHSLGSFSFRKGDPKPPVTTVNYEQALKQFLESEAIGHLPDGVRERFLEMAKDVVKACTTTTPSEPSEPVLRPYWAK